MGAYPKKSKYLVSSDCSKSAYTFIAELSLANAEINSASFPKLWHLELPPMPTFFHRALHHMDFCYVLLSIFVRKNSSFSHALCWNCNTDCNTVIRALEGDNCAEQIYPENIQWQDLLIILLTGMSVCIFKAYVKHFKWYSELKDHV